MKQYKQLLTEAPQGLHKQLQAVLDSNDPPHLKRGKFVIYAKGLGKSSGVYDDMALGSSRTVAFHRVEHPVKLDGKDLTIPTVTKIAHTHKDMPGSLESYAPDEFGEHESLGTHQNEAEANYISHKKYSVMTKGDDGHFTSNREGILPPLVDKDEKHHSWIQSGYAADVTEKKFKEMTKAPGFGNGLTHKKFHNTILNEWANAHGHAPYSKPSKDHDDVCQHPFVKKVNEFCLETNTHPADFVLGNIGKWHNPSTHEDHLVLRDTGYTSKSAEIYTKIRKIKDELGHP